MNTIDAQTNLPPVGRGSNLPADRERIQDCWRQIGVYGNRSCPELEPLVHCRNCSVYAKVAAQLLEQPMWPEYQRERTEYFAQEKRPRETSTTSAVLFRVRSEWLALPTHCFQEVAERRPIHSLPHARRIVLGLANVRGELLICISLGHLLAVANAPPRHILRTHYHRLLVLGWNGQRLGFPVDEVQGPYRFNSSELRSAPAAAGRSSLSCAVGLLYWQQRAASFLDPAPLCSAIERGLA